jgi:hypothetical protein
MENNHMRKMKLGFALALGVLALAFAFTNCSKVEFAKMQEEMQVSKLDGGAPPVTDEYQPEDVISEDEANEIISQLPPPDLEQPRPLPNEPTPTPTPPMVNNEVESTPTATPPQEPTATPTPTATPEPTPDPIEPYVCGKHDHKLSICHKGDDGKGVSLCLPEPAVKSHKAHHEDYLGPCRF